MMTAGSMSATVMCLSTVGGFQTSIQPVARYCEKPQMINASPANEASA